MTYYRVRRTSEQIQNGTELYHHGILGQKWGIRRFQNKDGTRTSAGKKRYASTSGNYTQEQYEAAKEYLTGTKYSPNRLSPNETYYSHQASLMYDRQGLINYLRFKLEKPDEWTDDDEEFTDLMIDDLRRGQGIDNALKDLVYKGKEKSRDNNRKRQSWFKQENDYYDKQMKNLKESGIKLGFDPDEFRNIGR